MGPTGLSPVRQVIIIFFFLSFADSLDFMCFSLFFSLLPLPGKMARYLRDPSGDGPLPRSLRHRGLHHGSGSAQNQARPGPEIRRAGVHRCVVPPAAPRPLPGPRPQPKAGRLEGSSGSGNKGARRRCQDLPCSQGIEVSAAPPPTAHRTPRMYIVCHPKGSRPLFSTCWCQALCGDTRCPRGPPNFLRTTASSFSIKGN